MTSSHYKIITIGPERIFTLDQAAELTGMHPEMILEFVRAELVHVQVSERSSVGSHQFDESALVRLRHIESLRHEHVNLRTVRYIVNLLDRLEATNNELRALRERLR